MKSLSLAVLLVVAFAAPVWGADEPAPGTATSSRMRDVLNARAEEAAKKKPAAPAPAPAKAPAAAKSESATPAADPNAKAPADAAEKTETPPAAPELPAKDADVAAKESPTVLPQVEVRKDRITELDIKLHEQKREIRREAKNTKPSEVDDALNSPKVSKLFAIFGGESSKHRAGIARERVELMEAESELMEAIAQTKSKEEKAELEKQLDQLKAFRRELEKSLR